MQLKPDGITLPMLLNETPFLYVDIVWFTKRLKPLRKRGGGGGGCKVACNVVCIHVCTQALCAFVQWYISFERSSLH